MSSYQPHTIIGFHSCDKEVGLKVLNCKDVLRPSRNLWDWLGYGTYFWEQDPLRALQYSVECSQRKQFNKVPIKTPFVLGAIIDLGNCLNLVEASSLQVLTSSYDWLKGTVEDAGKKLPVNSKDNRALDCSVIEGIHRSNIRRNQVAYDTVRCAFPEGEETYPGSSITSRLHIQVCVRNPDCIKAFFLPQPVSKFNPFLRSAFSHSAA